MRRSVTITAHDRWVAECLARADALATAAAQYGQTHDYLGATWGAGGRALRAALLAYRAAREGR